VAILPQLMNIVRVMVQDDPANIRCRCGACDLREPRPTRRFEHDRIGSRRRRTLDVVQQLLALCHRVVVGMDDLDIHTKTPRRFIRRSRLLLLIVVIVVGKRDQETKFFSSLSQGSIIVIFADTRW